MIRRDGLLDCLARAGRRHPSVGTWPDLRAVVAQTTYSDKGFVIAARCWQGLVRRRVPGRTHAMGTGTQRCRPFDASGRSAPPHPSVLDAVSGIPAEPEGTGPGLRRGNA